jgi:anti-sigma regulatory factor (Ser/Thr protein kinase)
VGDTAAVTTETRDQYIYDALLYGSDEELLGDAVPFLRAGLDAGETVTVICTERPAALLRAALGGDPRVRFLSGSEVYGRTPQAILAFRQLLEQEVAAGARRVRVVGQVGFGDHPADWSQGMRYEAIINRALAPYPVWGVCLYDTRRLPAEVVAAAALTHPFLRTAGSRTVNPRYLDPVEFLRRFADRGADPLEATAPTLEVDNLSDLRHLRDQLHAVLAGSALGSETTGEFVFAVSEVATNAVRYGHPPIRVRLWSASRRLLCTVTDHGPGIDDPFAGYVRAHRDPARGGLGLWLARRLCDHVTLRRTPEGFTVRLATGS